MKSMKFIGSKLMESNKADLFPKWEQMTFAVIILLFFIVVMMILYSILK